MIDKKIVELVVAKISAKNYGEIIPHQNLAADLGVKYGTLEYATAVTTIRKGLLERGKHIENVFKVGYRVTPPDHYAGQALRKYRQGSRRISEGQKILDFAPTEQMTQEGLSQYRQIKDRSTLLAASMAGAIVELKLLQRKHPLKG